MTMTLSVIRGARLVCYKAEAPGRFPEAGWFPFVVFEWAHYPADAPPTVAILLFERHRLAASWLFGEPHGTASAPRKAPAGGDAKAPA